MMPQEDPFASVRIRKNKIEPIQQETFQEQPIQQQQLSSEDPFSQVRVKKAEGFPFLYETGRHATRVASRISETIGGIPGDISSLIQSGVFAGLEGLVGHKLSEEGRKEAKKYRAPTTKELREFSEEVSGGFTSPQSDIEKSTDEYVETAASLLGPMKFRKALGVALGGQLIKEGAKTIGFAEVPQEAAKIGTMFLLTNINPGGALKYASSQYQKANSLSKGTSIAAKNLEENLKNLTSDLRLGVTTPSKNAVIKPAEEVIGKIQNGKIAVHDLIAAKRDLNTLIKDPALLKREKKLLLGVGKQIDNALKPFEKVHPEFSKAYRDANEIYGAVMQGTKASDFINKNLGPKSVLGAIIGEAVLGHPELIIPTFGTAATAFGGAKTLDFFTRISKSTELRKYYINAMKSAAKEDLGSLRFYSNKIDELLEKD